MSLGVMRNSNQQYCSKSDHLQLQISYVPASQNSFQGKLTWSLMNHLPCLSALHMLVVGVWICHHVPLQDVSIRSGGHDYTYHLQKECYRILHCHMIFELFDVG
jgi:hypothetical protein